MNKFCRSYILLSVILFWLALGLFVSQKNNHENVVMLSTDSYDCHNFSPEVHYVHNGETREVYMGDELRSKADTLFWFPKPTSVNFFLSEGEPF